MGAGLLPIAQGPAGTGGFGPSLLGPNGFVVGPPGLTLRENFTYKDVGDIIASPFVQFAMAELWQTHLNDSLNGDIGARFNERGAWVLRNKKTGEIAVTTIGVTLMGDHRVHFEVPKIDGWEPIAMIHTHWGQGKGAGLQPSPQDQHPFRLNPDTNPGGFQDDMITPIPENPEFPAATFNQDHYVFFIQTVPGRNLKNPPKGRLYPWGSYRYLRGDFPVPPGPFGPGNA